MNKQLAAKELLDSAINTIRNNHVAQTALAATGGYLGAQAYNAISPWDIDPNIGISVGLASYALGKGLRPINREHPPVSTAPRTPRPSVQQQDLDWDEWNHLLNSVE